MFKVLQMPKEQRLEALATQYPELDASAIRACIFFLKVAADLEASLIGHFARHGLSQGRFHVMILLHGSPDGSMTPSEIAGCACVKNATITGLIDGLEKDGLVRRDEDPDDRRLSHIRLTPKGRKHLQGMLPDHFRKVAGLMRHLSPRERGGLMQALQKIELGLDALQAPAESSPRARARRSRRSSR